MLLGTVADAYEGTAVVMELHDRTLQGALVPAQDMWGGVMRSGCTGRRQQPVCVDKSQGGEQS